MDGVEGDHLTGLELSAGDDGRVVDAEDAGLAGDVEPAALVAEPAHRTQAHAIDQADEDLAVGGDDAGGAVPAPEAAEGAAIVGEDVDAVRPQTSASLSQTGGMVSRRARSSDQFFSSIRCSSHSSRLAESLIFGVSRSPAGQGRLQAAGVGVDGVAVGADAC